MRVSAVRNIANNISTMSENPTAITLRSPSIAPAFLKAPNKATRQNTAQGTAMTHATMREMFFI